MRQINEEKERNKTTENPRGEKTSENERKEQRWSCSVHQSDPTNQSKQAAASVSLQLTFFFK